MSRRRKMIFMAVVLFIAINSLLVYMDDEDRVPRVSYIEDWSETVERDMYESIDTAGVLATAEEKHVYFDQNKGSFQEFHVEEGASVNTGDQLFTYQVHDYYETMADLEGEQQQLTSDIQTIEAALASISSYQVPETDMTTELEGENGTLDMTSKSVDANYMKEQYMTEKETELAQKEAKLQRVQSQISDLETTGETVTVESPYQGEVTAVSDSLDNPVVTIRDSKLQVEGELTESERMDVRPDMPVKVDIKENQTVLEGTLSDISDSPGTASLHGTSLYPFAAEFEEETEASEAEQSGRTEGPAEEEGSDEQTEEGLTITPDESSETEESESEPSQQDETTAESEKADAALLPGYHADLTIITNESPKAAVVNEDNLFNNHLWKMTSEGLLLKQPVEAGIHMDDLVEITEGANPGEWVAHSDEDQFRDGAAFMTPLELSDIEWKDPGKYDNVNWNRYFIIGLLSR
ncbi:efflux RND transporter periplasmic adaptor subunit [Lentibacillus salicampi]|uniref:YknX-like barrel-sandwich hybrid domain-containing protein n=1 Tax=Lentibacillus salicampi TaxID=175306 RepID=A0A4Y9A7L8_9BACI|nr:HlyD family efflux transporter periplasmic adaptor subunit [Lentibacillus salicampi]TFJ91723.1 hypothetical protein E4U82_16155 [Lentibacillus salicampi]